MTETKYGPVTIERWMQLRREGIELRVFHDGRDITTDCVFADDTDDGMAEVLLRNEEGHHYRVREYFEHWDVPEHLRPGPAKGVVRGVTFKEIRK